MSTDGIRPDVLAIVVRGLWPNVGRVVYVSHFVPAHDFTLMGLGIRDGWRVRSWSGGPLATIDGPRMVGFTPVGSLRRLDPLPPNQRREVTQEMAMEDFNAAIDELTKIFEDERDLVDA
jgi:hypothetical protein